MTKEVGELIFDLVYLAVIWTIVFKMYGTLHRLAEERLPLARTLALAFALLALGDTGHVGFRVVAHLAGGVEANPQLLGVGKLATAITVTVFYALLVRAWKAPLQQALRNPCLPAFHKRGGEAQFYALARQPVGKRHSSIRFQHAQEHSSAHPGPWRSIPDSNRVS